MVKINKTLGLALLTALAASCSSDNDVTGTNNPTIENGEGNYATLKIDLPTRAGVRAVDFKDDGLASEYAVNDATLLVFKQAGKSEGDYTFVDSVDLGNMNPWQKSTAKGITTTANVTVKLTDASYDFKNNNYYGLVILNNKADDGTTDKITLPAEGTNLTYSAWNKSDNAKAMQQTKNGIVMANAPKWTASSVPTTLVQIDGSKVKPTKAQAEAAGAAADIHVERGLAKVTLAQYGNDNTITVDDKSIYKDCTVKLDAWALDVTNRSSFPVHNIVGLDTDYKDIWTSDGTASIKENSPSVRRFVDGANSTFKRVYWGIDPNYSGSTLNQKTSLEDCKKAFNMVHDMDAERQSAAFKTTFGDNNPQYCLENTFDIDNMTQGQTTRVLIKATFSVPTDGSWTDPKDPYKSGDNLYRVNNSILLTSYELSQQIHDYISENFGKDVTVKIDNTAIANTAGLHQLADENSPTSSAAKVRTRAFGSNVESGGLSPEESEKVVNAFKITTYKNGVCYYVGRIKHFGDDETPWSVGNPTYYDTAKSIDKATGNLKWLGRYGVLRNNWYSLSVGSVSAPGDPVIPQVVPENPDDDNFNYINLSVNVLNWAKRTNGFDL